MTNNKPFTLITNNEYFRSPEDQEYLDMLVKEKSKLAKIPPTTTQCASTQAALDRDPANDEEHFRRALPPELEWKREIIERPISIQEFQVIDKLRHSARNTLGESKESSISKDKRENGIQAFTYSKPYEPTDRELNKLNNLIPMKNVIIQPESLKKEVNKDSLIQKIRGLLFGKEEGTADSKTNLTLKGDKIVWKRDD